MGSHNLEQSSSQTYSNQTSNQTTLPSTMESIKNTANYVGDKVNEATSGASKEANNNVAKDSDASVGTRASAAKDALGDKVDESKNYASHSVTSTYDIPLQQHLRTIQQRR